MGLKAKSPKEGAKKRQADFTERQRLSGLVKWQKWVTPTEAEALDAMLFKLRDWQTPNAKLSGLRCKSD